MASLPALAGCGKDDLTVEIGSKTRNTRTKNGTGNAARAASKGAIIGEGHGAPGRSSDVAGGAGFGHGVDITPGGRSFYITPGDSGSGEDGGEGGKGEEDGATVWSHWHGAGSPSWGILVSAGNLEFVIFLIFVLDIRQNDNMLR